MTIQKGFMRHQQIINCICMMTALFICSACGHAPAVVDPAFQPYLDRFQVDAGKSINPVTIRFGEIAQNNSESTTNAVCDSSDDIPVITISQSLPWADLNDMFRETLLYHELGHCLLDRTHDSSLWIPDGLDFALPNSIMYPELPNLDFYSRYRAHYIQELFNGQ